MPVSLHSIHDVGSSEIKKKTYKKINHNNNGKKFRDYGLNGWVALVIWEVSLRRNIDVYILSLYYNAPT